MDALMQVEDFAPMAGYVHGKAIGTTHEVLAVPTEWIGRKIVFKARGGNVWILFGTSATIEVDRNAVSTGVAPALVVSAKKGMSIDQDGYAEFRVYEKDPTGAAITHFAVESDSASGSWEATFESLGTY